MKTEKTPSPAPIMRPAPIPETDSALLACQSADDWEDLTAIDPFDLLDLTKGH